jgi:NDP-sugar pyrophosphorylase family protein
VLGTEAPPGNVRLDERQDRVLEYVRGGREGLEFVHAGMFVLAREWLGLMRNEEGSSVESALCAPLIERGTLRAFVAEERFYDMGTPDQLRTLETAIQARLGLSA